MQTIVILNIKIGSPYKKTTRLMKTFDLPFKLSVGDPISLPTWNDTKVKKVDIKLEPLEITVNLEDIIIDAKAEDAMETYEGTIEELTEYKWNLMK